jgi:hypothetical protein
MGTLLLIIGVILCFVGGIWLLIQGFQESIFWGIGMLLFGPVGLVFAIMHWSEAKVPFLIQVAGVVLLVAGVALNGPPQPAG